jgi:hypothetical protein
MRRLTFIALSFAAATISAAADDHPAKLVGRWRSENMPVGYWVIDRYSDGRLAKKEYVRNYSDQPAEITATWGRWRLRGSTYQEFFQGATSKNARTYVGKWWKMQVQRVTVQRFYHLSGDGHDTFEDRFSDRRPLLAVRQSSPKQYGWKHLVDTIEPARAAIPVWVNAVPQHQASKPMQRTAGRSAF